MLRVSAEIRKGSMYRKIKRFVRTHVYFMLRVHDIEKARWMIHKRIVKRRGKGYFLFFRPSIEGNRFLPLIANSCDQVNFSRLEMDSYDDMSRVLITDDVDSQCVDMLVANGFAVEKDIKLAKQPQEQLIKKVQVYSIDCWV